jgi:hypothetical protein
MPYSFERPEEGYLIIIGSWKAFPSSGWVPYSSIRIECRREHAECIEFEANLALDEHGEHPGLLRPDLLRYRIETWSPDEIRATGMLREQWPVELTIHPQNGYARREYPNKRDRYDGSEYWLLK